jgi:hypothetical protein
MQARGTFGAAQNRFGLVTGSATAIPFPDEPCIMAKLQARLDNVETFLIGDAVDNTVFELDAGEETDWFEVNNLNQLWHYNVSGTQDQIVWWLQR